MYRILFHVISKLPDDTWIYCGHEYTKTNIKFALTVDPNNEALLSKWAWCQDKSVTVPSTLGQEKMYNPFLRVNENALKMAIGKSDPVEVLHSLREMRNAFR